MIAGNGFIPNDGPSGTVAPWFAPLAGGAGPFPPGSPGNVGYGANNTDAVRPAWFGSPDPFGSPGSSFAGAGPAATSGLSMSAILAQLSYAVQQYIGKLGSALLGTPSANASGGTATFANVALSSAGDPHLAVSGTEQNAGGTTSNVSSTFDSMSGQADLFSTNDFGDGFNVATTVTQPNANGVTLNASATASMNGGLDSVTMTGAGAISVTSGGIATALAPGQTISLGGGEQVSEAAGGSVSITETAGAESLTTTFAQNNSGGVDVTAQGQGVTLSGDLITGGTTPVAQPTPNARQPLTFRR
jgi:hypothetical protein